MAPQRERRNRRLRRVNRNHITGSRSVFATISAGQQAKSTAKDVVFPRDRPCRVIRLHGSVMMFRGTASFFDVQLCDSSGRTVASSGTVPVATGVITRFSVRPPAGTSMWIDADFTASSTLNVAIFNHVCITKDAADHKLSFEAIIDYEAGLEVTDQSCPSYTILEESRPRSPDSLSSASSSLELVR